MMKKKVTYFCMYFYPEITSSLHLMLDLVTDSCNLGLDTMVLTASPSRNVSEEVIQKYKKIKDEIFLNGIKVHRIGLFREKKNIINRVSRFLLFSLKSFFYLLKNKSDVIVVDSTPPFLIALTAIAVSKLKKVKLIYRLQDIFPETLISSGKLNNKIIISCFKIIEKFILRKMDKIIVISYEMKQNLLDKGILDSKIEVIENWIDTDKVQEIAGGNNFAKEFDLNESNFNIVFAGNIGYAQDFDIIVKAAERVKQDLTIVFYIIGDGVEKERIEGKVLKLGLENVVFIPFQPQEKVSEVYSFADVNLITLKKNIIKNAQPSKTASIMACRRPIIASVDRDSLYYDNINNNNLGIAVDVGDIDSFVKAIYSMKNNTKLKEFYANNCLNYVETHLSRKVQTKKYIDIINQIGAL